MNEACISKEALDLLDELASNNERDWFMPRKTQFRDLLQDPFARILESASTKMRRAKPRGTNKVRKRKSAEFRVLAG